LHTPLVFTFTRIPAYSKLRDRLFAANAFFSGNLALNKHAVQLTTFMVSVADLAVDGHDGSQSCTAVHDAKVHPWWAVDLGAAYRVGRVRVTSGRGNYRPTCFTKCLFQAYFRAENTPENLQFPLPKRIFENPI